MAMQRKLNTSNSQEKLYSDLKLDAAKIPQHVAIIMDGNGRWAKKRFMPRTVGHQQGAEALRETLKACAELGIKYLTVYVFSTENWARPIEEVQFLMKLLKKLILEEVPALNEAGAKVKCLGALEALDSDLQDNIREAEKKTAHNEVVQLNLMINYGAKSELLQAVKTVVSKYPNPEELNEASFSNCLYTVGIPDPDILIRTGGDFRLSNYLLWQLAYSELFFLDILWPDFGRDSLIDVVRQFQKRERRFGGIENDH